MTKYARYYEDDSADVEWTNYVDLDVDTVTHLKERVVDVLPGGGGTNTYGDTVRYVHTWTITGECDRRTQDVMRDWSDNTFDSDTTLRLYDKYAAPYYTNYTAVKMKSWTTHSEGVGTRYRYQLVVVK